MSYDGSADFFADPTFIKCRDAFEARCDRDPIVRDHERSGLVRLFELSQLLGAYVQFRDSSALKNTSLVFLRTCDGKVLWKTVVQQSERKLEILPRGYFAERMDIYPAFAEMWERIPRDKAPAATPREVPSLRLRFVHEPEVWQPVVECLKWAATCK